MQMGWMMSEKTNLSFLKDSHQVVSFLVSEFCQQFRYFRSTDLLFLLLKCSPVNQTEKQNVLHLSNILKPQFHFSQNWKQEMEMNELKVQMIWIYLTGFCAKEIIWIAFLFEILARSMKLVARDRISSSELKFLPKWTLWVFLSSIRIRGNIKALKTHIV